MAGAFKLLLFLFLFSLLLTGFWAENVLTGSANAEPEVPDSVMKLEIEQLNAQILVLETDILERIHELNKKDDYIANMEKLIAEKSAVISALKNEMELLQKKGSLITEELVKKVHGKATELEAQVDDLRKELESQIRKREAVDRRAHSAEIKLQEINLKVEELEKANAVQKHRIEETERAFQVAEEELMRALVASTSKNKELKEVHGAWLPPWLATHMRLYQDLAATHWKDHAQPTLDIVLQKASERSAQAQEWLEPHLKSLKTNWIPAIKDRWVILVTTAKPCVHKVSTKTVEIYEASKSTIAPHIAKVQEAAEPYFQEAQKLSKPYIEQVAAATKPHIEKARATLNPYTERIIYAYKKLRKSTSRHHQI